MLKYPYFIKVIVVAEILIKIAWKNKLEKSPPVVVPLTLDTMYKPSLTVSHGSVAILDSPKMLLVLNMYWISPTLTPSVNRSLVIIIWGP